MDTRSSSTRLAAALVALTAAGGIACHGDAISSLGEPVPVRITMHRLGDASAAPAATGWFASVLGSEGSIDPATIASLTATLERIEFLPAVQEDGEENGDGDSNGNGDEEAGGWLSLDVDPVPLDLLALPTTTETGVVLATGELPVGDYRKVRLFVSDVLVVFNTAMQVGNATFEPDMEYVVTVPSGANTGIKTDQGFAIPEGGGDVVLVFDENASLANVTATGNGKVMLAPVIHVAGGGQ